MLPGKHSGQWHLPGGKFFPGQLFINKKEKSIVLKIFGTEYIDGTSVRPIQNEPYYYHPIILGDNPAVTLYNCYWASCSEIGTELYKITYKIEYVFTGVHFKDQELKIRHGTFIFPHLSPWFDGHEFFNKLKGKAGLYVDGKHIIQNLLKTEEVKINDDLTIFFEDTVTENIEKMNVSYKVTYHKFTHFQYSVDTPFTTLIKDGITFLKLISFCLGKPLGFFIVDVGADRQSLSVIENDSIKQNTLVQIHVNNYTLENNKKIETYTHHSKHMAVSGCTCSNHEMKQIIVQWFANTNLYNIYEYYLDSNNWMQGTKAKLSNVMFNNRFLNLIQGLEDFFREKFETTLTQSDRKEFETKKSSVAKTITDPELKKWLNNTFKFTQYPTLNSKLSRIIKELSDDLSQLLSGVSIEAFPDIATRLRHVLSHGMTKEINLGIEMQYAFHTAKLLLGVCILKSLDVVNLKNRVAYYSKFEDAVNEIIFFQNYIK